MPFDSDIYFIDFVLSFFSLCLSRFGIFKNFVQEIVQALTGILLFICRK